MYSLPHRPRQFWQHPRPLEQSRQAALKFARHVVRERRYAAKQGGQAFLDAHLGRAHLDLFRQEFPQTIGALPKEFSAVELGCGMGWMAWLLAAHAPGARVLATDVAFPEPGPLGLPNTFTIFRLAEQEPALCGALEFKFDQAKELTGMETTPRVTFETAAGESLPAPDASVDLHYSINTLEHVADLRAVFDEAARVLRVGGLCLHTTEPLYFTAYGHHMEDFFPIPWGHLLWDAEELADIVEREVGTQVEWHPGEQLRARHLLEEVFPTLNGAAPPDFRAALKKGPWSIQGWRDLLDPNARVLARELGLHRSLRNLPLEFLALRGLRLRLRREEKPTGLRMPMRMSATLRAMLGRG